MEGGIAILLIVIVLVVAGAIGLVMYLTGMSLGAKVDADSDHTAHDPVELRVPAREAERQLKPEVRKARDRRQRRHRRAAG
jgi:flagellar basal body-associated protein FliL